MAVTRRLLLGLLPCRLPLTARARRRMARRAVPDTKVAMSWMRACLSPLPASRAGDMPSRNRPRPTKASSRCARTSPRRRQPSCTGNDRPHPCGGRAAPSTGSWCGISRSRSSPSWTATSRRPPRRRPQSPAGRRRSGELGTGERLNVDEAVGIGIGAQGSRILGTAPITDARHATAMRASLFTEQSPLAAMGRR